MSQIEQHVIFELVWGFFPPPPDTFQSAFRAFHRQMSGTSITSLICLIIRSWLYMAPAGTDGVALEYLS